MTCLNCGGDFKKCKCLPMGISDGVEGEDEMKHTKGPWKVEIKVGFREIYNHEDIYICDADSEANANLIASAPDLLQVCKEAWGYLRFNKGNASPIFDRLEQAIKKAEEEL